MSNKSDPINFDAVYAIICWYPDMLQHDIEKCLTQEWIGFESRNGGVWLEYPGLMFRPNNALCMGSGFQRIVDLQHSGVQEKLGLSAGVVNLYDASDPVNHPAHYTAFRGVEVIQLTEHLNFCRGNAVKYLCRAGFKGGAERELEDLRKARWYIEREIARLESA